GNRAAAPPLLLVLLVLGDDRPRDAEAIDAGRGAAIDRDLRQRGADFVRGEPIGERAAHVGGELFHLAERADHAEIEQRALARFERLVAPGLAPAIFGEQPLKIAVEVVDVLQRAVDVSVAQNLFTFGKAEIVAFLVHGIPLFVLPLPSGEGAGGGGTASRSEPPHPNPLPAGEREFASRAALQTIRPPTPPPARPS